MGTIFIVLFILVLLLQFKYNKQRLIFFIFVISFFYGALGYVGIPRLYIKLIIDFLIVLLFITTLEDSKNKNNHFYTPGLLFFLFIVFISIISATINNNTYLIIYYYLKINLMVFLFFLAIYNMSMNTYQIMKINKLIVFLFIIQIVVSILKYFIIGVKERFAGTIMVSGTLSTQFPIFAMIFLFSFYLFYKRKAKFLILIICFMFMSWVGAKRGTWFYLPVFIIIILLIYIADKRGTISKKLKSSVIIILFAFLALIFTVRFIPTLNPENRFGGSFNLNHILSFAQDYNYQKISYKKRAGRFATMEEAYQQIKNKSLFNYLFGIGPESIYGFQYGDGKIEKYNIVDGQITGATYYMITIGILGSFAIVLFYLFWGIKLLKFPTQGLLPIWKAILVASRVITLFFLFDFFTYSRTTVTFYIPQLVYFYLVGIILSTKLKVLNKKCSKLY